MTEKEVLQIFKKEKAYLGGHFLLSSGLHSPNYMQCALVLQKPWVAQALCRALARRLKGFKIDAVIGPALGGVVVSYEMARVLKVRSLFAERVDGVLTLRRGFSLKKNEKVLVVEDVVTTGKSTRETMEVVTAAGAKPVAVAALVDRSGVEMLFSEPFFSLIKINIQIYKPEQCPLCKEGKLPAVKPGSRHLGRS
jgi:orotate phosphoribosyltransferase